MKPAVAYPVDGRQLHVIIAEFIERIRNRHDIFRIGIRWRIGPVRIADPFPGGGLAIPERPVLLGFPPGAHIGRDHTPFNDLEVGPACGIASVGKTSCAGIISPSAVIDVPFRESGTVYIQSVEHDAVHRVHYPDRFARTLINVVVTEHHILTFAFDIDGSIIAAPTFFDRTGTYKIVVLEKDRFFGSRAGEFMPVKGCVEMYARRHECVADIIVVRFLVDTPVEGYRAGAPHQINGVVGEYVVVFVFCTILGIVPVGEAVITIVPYGAVEHGGFRCAEAEVHAVGEIIAYAAVGDSEAVAAACGSVVVVSEPESALEVLYPHMVEY